MTFAKFCEAIVGRPLFDWEKKCAGFLEEHPDAKLIHPIARGSARMSYQERLSILFALYKACGKEENCETTEKIDTEAERMLDSALS
ncbi:MULTISPECIES: hypothetical protein [Bacteroides]|uniref:hypothetical protein n=1 Tax=Bacteroides TaxID=816 RepID=UPI0025933173|nr:MULTISPECIES: hypothetical protein [Bacteroides]